MVVTIIIYFIINNGGEPPTTPTPVTPETPTASFDSSLELSKDDIILDFGSKFEPNLDDLVTNNIFWGDIPLEYTLDIKDSERLSCSDELSKLSNISNLEELSNISEDNLDILVNIPQTPEYQISDSEMEAIIFRDINNQPLNLSDTQVFDIFTFFSDKNILEFSEILQQNIFIGEEKKGFFFFTFLISFFFFKKSWVISDF